MLYCAALAVPAAAMTKRIFPVLLAIVSLAFGALYAREATQNRQLSAQIAELETRTNKQVQKIKSEPGETATLSDKKAGLSEKLEARRQKDAAKPAEPAVDAS